MDYPGDLVVHLASFVALIGACAFESAAQSLGVDRSVLRRRIQTLETWIGTPLLEGRGSRLRPTAAGARLADRAARILGGVQELRADVALTRERVVVACTGTITTELLPQVLLALETRTPPVQLVVRRAGGALGEALVRSGDVDLGVVRGGEPPRDLPSTHLAADRLWFVVPAAHPLAKARKLTLAQMASVPLVLFGESSRTRARVMSKLAPHGATVRIEVEGRSAALEYVRAGIGATFLSLLEGHAVEVGRGLRAHDVTALFERSRFWIIGRPDRWTSPTLTTVISRMMASQRRRGS